MSKTKNSLSLFAICMHIFAVLITGGFWFVVLGFYFVSSRVHGRPASYLSVAANSFMFLITGGFWLIPIGIYYLTRK